MKKKNHGIKKLQQEIYEFVKQRRYVSFAEIQNKYGKGKFSIVLPKKNIFLWVQLPKEVVDAILNLIEEKKLFLHPSCLLVYFCDGKVLTLPIAKRIPKNGYKNPHWLPTVLDIIPYKKK